VAVAASEYLKFLVGAPVVAVYSEPWPSLLGAVVEAAVELISLFVKSRM